MGMASFLLGQLAPAAHTILLSLIADGRLTKGTAIYERRFSASGAVFELVGYPAVWRISEEAAFRAKEHIPLLRGQEGKPKNTSLACFRSSPFPRNYDTSHH